MGLSVSSRVRTDDSHVSAIGCGLDLGFYAGASKLHPSDQRR
jgi:hypothetical protein